MILAKSYNMNSRVNAEMGIPTTRILFWTPADSSCWYSVDVARSPSSIMVLSLMPAV